MRPDDDVRRRHLIESAETAIRFVEGRSRADLGEAAKQVTSATRAEHPNVPWSAAARMRDRLVHHYFDIDLGVLWNTIQDDLPALLAALSRRGTD